MPGGDAALHPSMRALEEPATGFRTRLSPVRLTLLGGACLIAPALRFYQEVGNPDVLMVIIASAILFLLVVARMAGLVRQEGRVVSRERALRGAGIDLVAAASHEQVCRAAIAGVRRLLGDDQSVRLSVLANGRAEVVASSDEAGWQLDESTAEWLSRTHAFSLRADYEEVPTAVRADLRLFAGDTVLVVPLSMRSEVRAMLVVCSPTSVQPALFDSLEALGAQISLALEGASLAADLHRRQSEARFRSLVAHSSDLITVLDSEGVVTYQSPSIERVLGYPVDDVEGSHFDRILSESDRPRLRQLIAGNGSSGPDGHTFECSLERLDGTSLKFEVQHTDLRHDEHVRGIVLNSRDVSERKAFEEQLAHQAFHY